jgi:hypothetical protein
MRRMRSAFYRDVDAVRSGVGTTEYHRDTILPTVMELLVTHGVHQDELLREAANAILDHIEKSEDEQSPGLFDYDSQIALGDKRRIRRGYMNSEQIMRRKRIIDNNKMAQDVAWRQETVWLNEKTDRLVGFPSDTRIIDVDAAEAAAAAAGAAHAGATP